VTCIARHRFPQLPNYRIRHIPFRVLKRLSEVNHCIRKLHIKIIYISLLTIYSHYGRNSWRVEVFFFREVLCKEYIFILKMNNFSLCFLTQQKSSGNVQRLFKVIYKYIVHRQNPYIDISFKRNTLENLFD
jgi:hypothetical protein